MTLDKEFLATISGVCCESTGRLPAAFKLEDIQTWCEQWLYERDSLVIDDNALAALMDACDLTRDDAARQLAIDAAALAWHESLEWSPDNISFAPIPTA